MLFYVRGAMAKCGPGESVAVLDLAPGRAASWTYRRAMAAVANGVYLAPPPPLGGAAVNLAKARTVLSLGAPVLDGWGTPGNVHAARANFRLIQAEPWESRTAALADEWLPIRPGSEAALALALKDPKTAPSAAQATGLTEKQILDLANELTANGPALVLSADDLPEALAPTMPIDSPGRKCKLIPPRIGRLASGSARYTFSTITSPLGGGSSSCTFCASSSPNRSFRRAHASRASTHGPQTVISCSTGIIARLMMKVAASKTPGEVLWSSISR